MHCHCHSFGFKVRKLDFILENFPHFPYSSQKQVLDWSPGLNSPNNSILALFFTTAFIIHFSHVSPTILRKLLTVCFTLCLLPSNTFSTHQAECPLKTQNVTPSMFSLCSSNIMSIPCHRFLGPACSGHYIFCNHTLTSDHNPAVAWSFPSAGLSSLQQHPLKEIL